MKIYKQSLLISLIGLLFGCSSFVHGGFYIGGEEVNNSKGRLALDTQATIWKDTIRNLVPFGGFYPLDIGSSTNSENIIGGLRKEFNNGIEIQITPRIMSSKNPFGELDQRAWKLNIGKNDKEGTPTMQKKAPRPASLYTVGDTRYFDYQDPGSYDQSDISPLMTNQKCVMGSYCYTFTPDGNIVFPESSSYGKNFMSDDAGTIIGSIDTIATLLAGGKDDSVVAKIRPGNSVIDNENNSIGNIRQIYLYKITPDGSTIYFSFRGENIVRDFNGTVVGSVDSNNDIYDMNHNHIATHEDIRNNQDKKPSRVRQAIIGNAGQILYYATCDNGQIAHLCGSWNDAIGNNAIEKVLYSSNVIDTENRIILSLEDHSVYNAEKERIGFRYGKLSVLPQVIYDNNRRILCYIDKDGIVRQYTYDTEKHFNTDNIYSSPDRKIGLLFDFGTGIEGFGTWFGDMESRTDGNGIPAEIQLFDYNGDFLTGIVIQPIEGETTIGASTVEVIHEEKFTTYIHGNCGDEKENCPISQTITRKIEKSVPDSKKKFYGNNTTRFIGFDRVGTIPARYMLVINGNNTNSSTIHGLSFMGGFLFDDKAGSGAITNFYIGGEEVNNSKGRLALDAQATTWKNRIQYIAPSAIFHTLDLGSSTDSENVIGGLSKIFNNGVGVEITPRILSSKEKNPFGELDQRAWKLNIGRNDKEGAPTMQKKAPRPASLYTVGDTRYFDYQDPGSYDYNANFTPLRTKKKCDDNNHCYSFSPDGKIILPMRGGSFNENFMSDNAGTIVGSIDVVEKLLGEKDNIIAEIHTGNIVTNSHEDIIGNINQIYLYKIDSDTTYFMLRGTNVVKDVKGNIMGYLDSNNNIYDTNNSIIATRETIFANQSNKASRARYAIIGNAGDLLYYTDNNGYIFNIGDHRFWYNREGNIVIQNIDYRRHVIDQEGNIIYTIDASAMYDKENNRIGNIYGIPHIPQAIYDSRGYISHYIDKDGIVREYTYDTQASFDPNMKSVTDPTNKIGLLFDFGKGVEGFGTWFGDMESRSDGNGIPAEIQLFDYNGDFLTGSIIHPLQGQTTSDKTQNYCGSTKFCGNNTTRFIGFNRIGDTLARYMLITNGNDTNNNQIHGLSFMGGFLVSAASGAEENGSGDTTNSYISSGSIANFYIGGEERNTSVGRHILDIQADEWKRNIVSHDYYPLDLGLGDHNEDSIGGIRKQFTNGLTVDITPRVMSTSTKVPSPFGLLDKNPWRLSISTTTKRAPIPTMQKKAPRPESLFETSSYRHFVYQDLGNYDTGSAKLGLLFNFGTGIQSFGTWFGDMETRTDGSGTAAEIKLFDSSGVLLTGISIPALHGVTTSGFSAEDCIKNHRHTFCGSNTTRFIGFDTVGDNRVQYMLVTNGDDTHTTNVVAQETQSNSSQAQAHKKCAKKNSDCDIESNPNDISHYRPHGFSFIGGYLGESNNIPEKDKASGEEGSGGISTGSSSGTGIDNAIISTGSSSGTGIDNTINKKPMIGKFAGSSTHIIVVSHQEAGEKIIEIQKNTLKNTVPVLQGEKSESNTENTTPTNSNDNGNVPIPVKSVSVDITTPVTMTQNAIVQTQSIGVGEALEVKTVINPLLNMEENCYNPNSNSIITLGTNTKDKDLLIYQSLIHAYGLTKYTDTDEYRPVDGLKRYEAAKMFVNFARNVLCRKAKDTYNNQYTDIDEIDDPTLLPYIKDAYAYGIMKGANSKFRPLDIISQKEFIASLMRMFLNQYLEKDGTYWYDNYEQAFKDYGLNTIVGVNNNTINRYDMSKIMYKLYYNKDYVHTDKGYELQYSSK